MGFKQNNLLVLYQEIVKSINMTPLAIRLSEKEHLRFNTVLISSQSLFSRVTEMEVHILGRTIIWKSTVCQIPNRLEVLLSGEYLRNCIIQGVESLPYLGKIEPLNTSQGNNLPSRRSNEELVTELDVDFNKMFEHYHHTLTIMCTILTLLI